MRILRIDSRPFFKLFYLNAGRKGRTDTETLPLYRGYVDALPAALDALLVTSDLQGVARSERSGELRLLGQVLAEKLYDEQEKYALSPSHTGVILAGDLYSDPEAKKRGATGDVRSVWETFADHFRWVVGVAGNHDTYGNVTGRRALQADPKVHIFDGDSRTLDGLHIGGVGGIIGHSKKNERKSEDRFLSMLLDVLEKQPELVVLHEGPPGHLSSQRGHQEVERFLNEGRPCLTICGHSHWSEPLADRGPAGQVLNVDARAVLLIRA